MTEQPPRSVFIKTYGCQMNAYDSTRMAGVLSAAGYVTADTAEAADLVVLNTCHIREKASEKVYSEIGLLKAMRARTGRDTRIAVAGCVAQAEGEEILARAPAVDLVVGPQSYHRLPELLREGRRSALSLPAAEKFARLAPAPAARGLTAFLTVQEGCDKFCSFCVVPYTRGAEFSRPVAQVLAEAQGLADQGVREITLLGQNVNAYRGADADGALLGLGGLIERLSRIDGIARIRFTTSHPRDMDDALIACLARNPKAMPYLHLPIQSGSDRILKAMNRGHDARHYLDLIAAIRRARPDIALSGDFIVGFPGETEEDFEATLALMRAVGYAGGFAFKYSPRPGTPAAERGGELPEPVKTERLHRLQALLARQVQDFNRACLGRRLPVLFDKPGRRDGQIGGRSPYLQAVHVMAERRRIGEIADVVIDAVGENSLSGHIAEAADAA